MRSRPARLAASRRSFFDLPPWIVLHGQGVAEHEGNAFVFAEVREPVPGEHALGPDDEPLTIGFDRIEERRGRRGNLALEHRHAGGIADVDVQAPGMEIDAAVVWMRGLVEAWRHASVLRGDGPA